MTGMFPLSQAEGANMGEMPTWEEFLSPTLRAMADGVTRNRRELHPAVADEVQLSAEQCAITVASGQLLYANRIGWGLSLLAKTGALARPTRGAYVITEAGRYLLNRFPEKLTQREVKELAHDLSSGLTPYIATVRPEIEGGISASIHTTLTPVELIDVGMERITDELSTELISRLVEKDPDFFEEAVVKLLIGMGYGGELGKGWATRRSNDGGIDGVIDQDLLGLNKVYIQAKRYGLSSSPVGRPEIQSFVGALSGKADSGVFITTGRFSAGAIEYADNVPTRVILVDGEQLARLMIRFHIGVQETRAISMVEIDEDFFS
jgi:restriction system protein